jgi:hypothetical protein
VDAAGTSWFDATAVRIDQTTWRLCRWEIPDDPDDPPFQTCFFEDEPWTGPSFFLPPCPDKAYPVNLKAAWEEVAGDCPNIVDNPKVSGWTELAPESGSYGYWRWYWQYPTGEVQAELQVSARTAELGGPIIWDLQLLSGTDYDYAIRVKPCGVLPGPWEPEISWSGCTGAALKVWFTPA